MTTTVITTDSSDPEELDAALRESARDAVRSSLGADMDLIEITITPMRDAYGGRPAQSGDAFTVRRYVSRNAGPLMFMHEVHAMARTMGRAFSGEAEQMREWSKAMNEAGK